MATAAITTAGLTRRFETVTAVDRLSLEVEAGSVFGFLGPNGAGKTTTLRLLLGLLEPTAGQAQVLGLDVASNGQEVRRACGVLLEHHGLYERLSAEDNLDYFGRLWHLSAGERRSRITQLLDHFGLADRRREVVGGWSRGMKQKVAIGRALLHRPRLVFLDEPTAGLDPVAAVSLRNDLAALARQEGATVFITTHNLDEAERLCTRVGVINAGRLLAVGTPESLRTYGGRPRVEVLGSGFTTRVVALVEQHPGVASVESSDGRLVLIMHGSAPVAPLVRLLVEAGAEVEEVHKGAPSLEAAFLALLGADQGANTAGAAGGAGGADRAGGAGPRGAAAGS